MPEKTQLGTHPAFAEDRSPRHQESSHGKPSYRVGRMLRRFALFLALALPAVSHAQAQTVTIWVKAFIPNTGNDAVVPRPNNHGQTMVKASVTPNLFGCFTTDQRNFSSDRTASARLSSVLSFTLTQQGQSNWQHQPSSGVTHQVDCNTGSAAGLCEASAPVTEIVVNNVRFDGAQKILSFTMEGKGANPCVNLPIFNLNPAPKIHWKLNFAFNTTNRSWGVMGEIGNFPSFEAYIQTDNQLPQPVFQSKANAFALGVGIATSRQLEVTGRY